MALFITAACGCHMGKIRKNNEDNFYFFGQCLEEENVGLQHPYTYDSVLQNGACMAVFDGMGGESFGEKASHIAAIQTQCFLVNHSLCETSVTDGWKMLSNRLNDAVTKVQKEMCTQRIGTTMVGICFSGQHYYVCNVGDSRAYLLRNGKLERLSVDHIEKCPRRSGSKAPLTQYLGFGNEDIQIDPYLCDGPIQNNDIFLLCSDGLTDMLADLEITNIARHSCSAEQCVSHLIREALDRGGRDNVTVLACQLKGNEYTDAR